MQNAPSSLRRRSFLRAVAIAPIAIAASEARLVKAGALESTDFHPLVGTIWEAAIGQFVTRSALVARLAAAHFRLIGEVHDNPEHHRLQAEVLEGIVAAGAAPVLAFEQMDREHDQLLQERLAAGNAGAEDIAEAVRFDRKGWNWDFYRPLVETAIRHRLPLRAANLSRAAATHVIKKGLGALEPERIAALRIDEAWNAAREEALRQIIRDAHCGALPESYVPNMTAAQRVRDATLAEAMLAPGRNGAVLIAGNGHVRRDLSVPLYLAAAAPGRSSYAVGILEVDPERPAPQAYLRTSASALPVYDAVLFTARRQRPDPCAAFKREK